MSVAYIEKIYIVIFRELPKESSHRIAVPLGRLTIREAARRAGRDVKAVHGDIQSLLKAGILEKTDTGKVALPFDAVHVDFMVNVA